MDSFEDISDDSPPTIDPYEVLGLERTASTSDIKSAYRKAALKHHPGTLFYSWAQLAWTHPNIPKTRSQTTSAQKPTQNSNPLPSPTQSSPTQSGASATTRRAPRPNPSSTPTVSAGPTSTASNSGIVSRTMRSRSSQRNTRPPTRRRMTSWLPTRSMRATWT
jgi:hypothetical protein